MAGANALHKLEDIAAITRGAVCSKQSGFTPETMTLEQLGRAAQIRVTAERAAIIDGYGSPDAVQFRLTQLGADRDRATFGIDEDVLTERIGALSGKVGDEGHNGRPSWRASARRCCTPALRSTPRTSPVTTPPESPSCDRC